MNMQYLDNSVTIVLSVSGENSITIDHISKLKEKAARSLVLQTISTVQFLVFLT